MDDIDFGGVGVLTFDCYGTLIDWESGILAAFRRVIGRQVAADDELLEAYAGREASAEAGPWKPYRQILSESMNEVCLSYGVAPTAVQQAASGGSVAHWPAFPDSAEALAHLKSRFRLGVITNCDDDLFAFSDARLGEPFEWIITAQHAASYKQSTHNFELAFERIDRPRDSIVHVAQSLYHDHVPAKRLGLKTVWINRRQGRSGPGATPAADGQPDLTFPDMASFADAAAGPKGRERCAARLVPRYGRGDNPDRGVNPQTEGEMVRASRFAYVAFAWAFVVGMVAQVFLIGLGLLGGQPSGTTLHRDFGWLLHLIPLLVLLFAALSRAGRRHWQWTLALAVVVFLVPIFAIMRDSTPVLAALHPVAAVLAFPISLVVAMNALKALREPMAVQRPLTG